MEGLELARIGESVKSAHHRIDRIEEEIKDINALVQAMGRVDEKVENIKADVDEMKADIKEIALRPGKWWDKLAAALLGAVAAGLAAALLSLILR